MEKVLLHLKKMDWALIVFSILLVLFGIVSIYSSSFFRGDFLILKKQIIFLIVGFLLMIIFSFFNWKLLKEDSYLILGLYIIGIIFLGLVLFVAPETRGVRGWYRMGSFGLDPIEPIKIVLIILLAKYFSMRHIEMYNFSNILISGAYVALPCFLIFLQPDLGSVLVLLLLWIGILVVSGIETKHFFFLILVAVILFGLLWNSFLKDYQKERIISFVVPDIEPLGMGWSQLQSKIAIGSGGLWGKGFRSGSQVQLGFLTAPHNDFIFAAIAEEFGLIGISILLLLILLFFFRIIKIALLSQNNFEKLFVLSFAILFSVQVFINIGMNLGILPVIGISLPFVSYGGSSIVANFIGLGILQNIKISSI